MGRCEMSEKAQKALETFRELIKESGGIYGLLFGEHHSWESWDEMPDIDEAINELKALRKRVGELEEAISDYRHDGSVPMANAINNDASYALLKRTLISWRSADKKLLKALTPQTPTPPETEEIT
jgi:hypothetical protein